ncbi:MAG TPA: hypothetical protein VFT45_03320 [Longimicrobium sp.]|nr:hypothetical protein [Longimicrobium sp.]
MSRLRILVAALGFGGALLFGSAFVASYTHPTFVEGVAKNVIRAEVERRVEKRVDALDAGWLGKLAAHLALREEGEIAAIRQMLADSLHAKVGTVAAEMRDPDCACRRAVLAGIREQRLWRVSIFPLVMTRLTVLARTRYLDVSAKLVREFRIFTAANALVLLFLGIAVLVRRNARLHLLPPAVILVCSAGVVGWFYLFQQDWLHTIVFSDYVGLSYFAWLAAPVLLIGDVVLNRGRVSAHLLNAGTSVIGSAATVLPC